MFPTGPKSSESDSSNKSHLARHVIPDDGC
jgi:hypothetical protein